MKLPEQLKNRNALIGAGIGLLVLQILAISILSMLVGDKEPTIAKPAPAQKNEKCVSAIGMVWTGVRLHLDSDCAKPFATIVGGNENRNGQRMVRIRFDSGDMEWKTREAVIDQAYVKSDDPALKDASLLIINE
jgi:hypothetical protein